MRIVVISDSHKRSDIVEKILYAQPEASHIFFLGDHAADIEDLQYIFSDKKFYILSGNCDYFSNYPYGECWRKEYIFYPWSYFGG